MQIAQAKLNAYSEAVDNKDEQLLLKIKQDPFHKQLIRFVDASNIQWNRSDLVQPIPQQQNITFINDENTNILVAHSLLQDNMLTRVLLNQ